MANIMNNYFSSVFTIEQLNNIPQLRQYEGNILNTFNFSTEEVQEKLHHLNIYKSTGPDMLHPRILRALEDKLARPLTHIFNNSVATGIIIIIIIIKKGQQCKAGREWYTPYQSEDPSPTIPTYRQKEEKGKECRRL